MELHEKFAYLEEEKKDNVVTKIWNFIKKIFKGIWDFIKKAWNTITGRGKKVTEASGALEKRAKELEKKIAAVFQQSRKTRADLRNVEGMNRAVSADHNWNQKEAERYSKEIGALNNAIANAQLALKEGREDKSKLIASLQKAERAKHKEEYDKAMAEVKQMRKDLPKEIENLLAKKATLLAHEGRLKTHKQTREVDFSKLAENYKDGVFRPEGILVSQLQNNILGRGVSGHAKASGRDQDLMPLINRAFHELKQISANDNKFDDIEVLNQWNRDHGPSFKYWKQQSTKDDVQLEFTAEDLTKFTNITNASTKQLESHINMLKKFMTRMGKEIEQLEGQLDPENAEDAKKLKGVENFYKRYSNAVTEVINTAQMYLNESANIVVLINQGINQITKYVGK